MTFNASVPLNSDSPATFPAQNQDNMTVLNTILASDHQFNNTPVPGDNSGWHNLIHLTQQAPSGALASTGRLYVKVSGGGTHLFYMDSSGSEYQISPGMPIRAAVNFEKSGAIRSAYNVSSVTRNTTGSYRVNFTTAMPDINYIVQVTGMREDSAEVITGCVLGHPTYTTSISVNSVQVRFFGTSNNLREITAGFVTIFSVT